MIYSVETSEVIRRVKDDRLAVVNIKQLLQVEDLNVVIIRLAADNDVVLEDADLSPDGSRSAGSLRQTTEVAKLTAENNLLSRTQDQPWSLQESYCATHLCKSSAIGLCNDGKLPAVIRCPTPRR